MKLAKMLTTQKDLETKEEGTMEKFKKGDQVKLITPNAKTIWAIEEIANGSARIVREKENGELESKIVSVAVLVLVD
jgi:hypothetical protein